MWENDAGYSVDDKVDNFTFPLTSPLDKFNLSNSLTVQGQYRVGNLTLSYGNLSIDLTTPCNSVVQPTSCTNSYTPEGKFV